MKSTFLTLQARDFLKGLIMAVGTPVLYLVQELIPGWPLTAIEKAGLSAFVTYIIKNLFTDDTKAAIKTLSDQNVSIIENTATKKS